MKTESVLIRNASLKDAEIMEKMARDTKELRMLSNKTLGLKYFETIIEYGIVLVAEEDKDIVGFLLAEVFDVTQLSVLTYLVVLPEHRKQKIGEKLMECYLDKCKKRKTKLISLFAPKFNEKTLSFYKKLGFKRDREYVLFSKDL